MTRVYLDWNATAPLRPEARAAMAEGFDLIGNPSSVHAEGRAAKMALERARDAVAQALGCAGERLVFTSGATEAAALALAGRDLHCAAVEHDAVLAWARADLPVDGDGRVAVADPARSTLQLANSETGAIQALPQGLAVADLTQGFARIPFAFDWSGIGAGFVSAHKLGGPKGIGALALAPGTELEARIRGGGQERGRRAGTENLAAAMGFAAAAQAAQRDLAGFAVSAGSACSSGKVRPSGVLRAMGVAEADAACAIRVSIGPTTTAGDLDRFAAAWLSAHARWHKRQDGRDRPAGG